MSDPTDRRPGGPSQAASPGAPSGACQPFSLWLKVCAGTLPNDVSLMHLEHAAECRDCSGLLAQCIAALAPEPSAEEQALLNTLPSASIEGQQSLARALAQSSRGAEPEPQPRAMRRTRNPLFIFLAWGAVAVCALVIGAFLLLRPPSDAALLAEAYNQQRPSELRLAGTEPGPVLSPTRGSATAAESTGLLRLKLRANDDLEKQPNDPRTRQMLGRIALVEHNGDAARSNFEVAASLNPNLPGITADLASAYFELAESSGQPLNYARAIDLFSQHLARVHDDPVALYNRGLCWERQAVSQQAIADFQAALAAEKDARWRRDIESHIDRLRRGAAQQTSASQQPPSAADFLSMRNDPPGMFEMLLSLAVRQWLPLRGTIRDTDAALEKLAALGRTHNDLWLADTLAEPETPARRAADEELAEAVSASQNGNADHALDASAAAMRLYSHLARDPTHDPGYLRAAAEHVYTLQRMGLNQDCLREAAALASNRQLARYAWLRTYLQLEIAAAYDMLGEHARDRQLASSSAADAALDHLPLSSLRATSFVIDSDIRVRHYESAWGQATGALRLSQPVRGAAMARFLLLSGLIDVSKDLNLSWTATGLASAAASAVSESRNYKATAYAMEELGLDQIQTGNLDGADSSFRAADALLKRLGDGVAARRYAADWSTHRALLVARKFGPDAGARVLSLQAADYARVDAALPRLAFYTTYADLLRQAHQQDASIDQSLLAIAAVPFTSASGSQPAPQSLPPEARKAYEVLVADLSEDNAHPERALRAWELIETAGSRRVTRQHRSGVERDVSLDRESEDHLRELDALLPPLPTPTHLTLVLGRVLDHYVLWTLAPAQPVHQYVLSVDPAALSRRADTFLRLCSDPRSSIADLNILGAGLYRDLLASADDQIARATRIDLELDPSLASIPFAALESNGRYLGLDHSLVFLPATWTLAAHEDADHLPPQPHLAVLEQAASTSSHPNKPIPADYDESADILRLFPSTQLERAMVWRSGSDVRVSGSPALKPLLAQADLVHYVGHGLNDGSEGGTVPMAEEEPALTLSSGAIPRCRLAVLAACQTLREREESREDVPSFARVVMAAGAAHVLATQWDVDSRETSRLMQHFYAGLAAGNSFADALRAGQQSLASDSASAHPYFWSGFQLVGNP